VEPFLFPPKVRQNERGQIEIGDPTRRQLEIRIKQLLGDRPEERGHDESSAITNFLVQKGAMPGAVPPQFRRMRDRATEDATFWIAVLQFEKGEYEGADENFREYLAQYREGGRWSPHCRFLRAWSLAERGEFRQAAQLLESAPSTDPQSDGYAVYIRRWTRLADAKEPKPQEKPQG
jgi:TolA-binding protein